MEKRIVVPDGMLKAFKDSLDAQYAYVVDGHDGNREYAIEPALEAALRWLSENPTVPTDGDICDLHKIEPDEDYLTSRKFAAVEWQRRMFLAPDPDVPEKIKDYVGGTWSTPTKASSTKTTAPIYCREGQTVGEALAALSVPGEVTEEDVK